jgi:NADH dehydrogenase/NADH:ubiquinone oxidoreductase subunit G
MTYWYIVNHQLICPICKQKITEHTEFQDKICKMITVKQFANNCPGFDVQFRPFFED